MRYGRAIALWITVTAVATVFAVAKRPAPEERAQAWGYAIGDSGKWAYQQYPVMKQAEITRVFTGRMGAGEDLANRLAKHLLGLCRRFDFDPALILSVIHTESSFRMKARSHKGALGLMQVMPITAQDVMTRLKRSWQYYSKVHYQSTESLKNPFVNLSIGVAYLAWLRDRYDGRLKDFLAAYNAGPRKVDRQLRKHGAFRPRVTRKYITKIRSNIPVMRSEGERSKVAVSEPEPRPTSNRRERRAPKKPNGKLSV